MLREKEILDNYYKYKRQAYDDGDIDDLIFCDEDWYISER